MVYSGGDEMKRCTRKGKVLAIMLAAVLLLNAWPRPAAAEADLAQLVREVEPAILFIQMYDQNGDAYGLGSGFFVSPEGEFLTNRHVLKDAFYAVAITPNGKVYPVTKIIGIHPEADLVKATVGNVTEPVPFLRISREGVVKGQHIYVFGNPEGLSFTVSDGIISAFRTIPQLGELFQMTAPISGGSSGGPVVNAGGEVVGISVAVWREGQNLNFAVRAKAIGELVTPSGGPLVLNQAGDVQQPGPPARPPKRPADGKRFLYFASGPDFDTYLDMGTITLINNRDNDAYRLEFWVRDIYNQTGKARVIAAKTKEGKGEKYFNFASTFTQFRVNPATDKVSLLRLVYYDDTGRTIEAVDFTQLPQREEKIAPGSLIEKAVALIARLIKEKPGVVNRVSE
ncbi:MAG TPA: serine protease, partial [Negativicutes bacterium]|nr:serine protease [Negativicutes bacterium]